MPNGRSGGFYLKRVDFERLLSQLAGDVAVGKTLDESLTASRLQRMLKGWKGDEVLVEEQDHSWYIVHFSEWVTVDEKSPLFGSFRQTHAQFLRELAKRHHKDDRTV